MKNIKMILQYDGGRYRGWQKQKNTSETISEKIETALTQILGKPISIHGAGRTDMGVHAQGQVANFWCDGVLSVSELKQQLNAILPQDIRVRSMEEVAPRFHSRLWASRKHYRYRICLGQRADVFSRKYVWQLDQELDLERMRQAASDLVGTRDFRALCDEKKKDKSTVRRVERIDISTVSEEDTVHVILDFYGDGFLYHEVRHMVALLVNIASKKEPIGQVKTLLETPGAHYAALAPAQGLCLMAVDYVEEQLDG